MHQPKNKRRGGLRPGIRCGLCGQECDSWQSCVSFQKLRPYNPADYAPIYDTSKPYTQEQYAARIDHFKRRFPFMTDKQLILASILEGTSHVCSKAGGSAGSGQYSKHLENCRIAAQKRGIFLNRHDEIIPPDDDDFY